MFPYYVVRAIGGGLYLTGALIMAYNVTMTILGYQRDETAIPGLAVQPQPAE